MTNLIEAHEEACRTAAELKGWRVGGDRYEIIYDSNIFESWKAAFCYAGDDGRDQREKDSITYGNWSDCCEGEEIEPADLITDDTARVKAALAFLVHYGEELDRLEIPPNGDDYNDLIMGMASILRDGFVPEINLKREGR